MAWTERAFDLWYLVVYPHRDGSEARDLTQLLSKSESLGGSRILDVGCGPGRHLEAFEDAGAFPVGLDQSAALLGEASRRLRSQPKSRIRLVRADMRHLPFGDAVFDGATSLFTTFGYHTEVDDRTMIEEVARVVRPNGFFLFDFLNREHVLRNFQKSKIRHQGEFEIRESKKVECDIVIKHVAISRRVSGEPVADYEERVFLYTPETLRGFVQRSGFRIVEVWGDYRGEAFHPDSSSRHVLFCRKEQA